MGVRILYDGACPFCASYVRYARLKDRVGEVDLVDARQVPDYEHGHVPGAVNVPPGTEWPGIEDVVGTDLGRPLVLYCQSEGCPYDDDLGAELIRRGYRSVSLVTGGYVAWTGRAS